MVVVVSRFVLPVTMFGSELQESLYGVVVCVDNER